MNRLKYICFISFFVIIFGCSRDGESSSQANDRPLIFLHYWSDELDGGIDSMVYHFNNQNSGFQIKATGFDHESYKMSMKVMLAGGNPPDLFSYWAGARTEAFVKKGYLAPLDSIWEVGNIENKFSEGIVNASTYDGKKYIIPVTQHYVAFFYNKPLFDSLNLVVPTTWDEFVSLSDTLKKSGITPIALGSENRWPAQFWFDYVLLRTAGDEYRKRLMHGEASYSDSEVIRAFELWKELVDSGFFNDKPEQLDWVSAANSVAEGDAAMTLMGTWITGYFDLRLDRQQGVDYDYFTFPIIDPSIEPTALGPIDGILLPQDGDITRAEEVLALFMDVDVQSAMSLGSGAISPSSEVVLNDARPVQKRIKDEIQTYSNWAFNYDLATPAEMAELGLTLFEDFLNDPHLYRELLEELERERQLLPESEWE